MARIRIKEAIPDEEDVDQAPVIAEAALQTLASEPLPSNPAPQTTRRNLLTKTNLAIAGILLVVLFVLITLISLLNDRKHLKNEVTKLSSSQTTPAATNDAQKYQDAVSKLVEVPAGITPRIETPNDEKLNQLKQANSLYKDAKNGDIFLVYSNPDKSIFLVIYRQSNNKIVLAVLDTSQQAQKTKP